ncbi:MAG: hypothetical protein IJ072_02545, partial [Oscillospiraceae bacterium]|nr:hypothetical protein [Oscillospiraceae bacterium]
DYYNKQGLYYSAAIDAEMSLILAECSLLLGKRDFEKNSADYERAVREISFSDRYDLTRAEYLIRSGRTEEAAELIDGIKAVPETLKGRLSYVRGLYYSALGRHGNAMEELKGAEALCSGTAYEKPVYRALEECCLAMGDYKGAYEYAAKQREG